MSASAEGKTCPKCQAFNFSGDVFCFNCGTNLGDQGTLSLPGAPGPSPAAADLPDLPSGTRFADRYLIIEEIGCGSMGRVFKAKDLKLDQTVVLKMIRPEHSSSPMVVNLFKKETSLARSLSQENIIRVFDLGESQGVTFISMEYVPGQNLEQLLQASGTLTEATAVSITRQICRALDAAHKRGIIHRDLKPQNILIDANGRVRVADFGLAQTIEVSSKNVPGRIVGTPAYLSPEQARGEEADARSDIYALGVIMYEILTGRKPFTADTIAGYLEKHLHEKPKSPKTWNPGLSHRLEMTILRCLEKDPDKRFPSAGRVLQTLEERRLPASADATKSRRRNRNRFVVSAAALGLTALGIYFFFLRNPAPPAPSSDRTSVAVMYFENNTGDPNLEYLRKGLCYQVIQSLLQSARLRVITTDRLFDILRDRNLLGNETYSTNDLKKVAERAQVRYILQGNYAKIGRMYKVNSFLLDTNTWESAGSIQSEVEDLNQLNSVVERMTPEIKAALPIPRDQISAESARRLDKITTSSPEALTHYIEGETLFKEGKFRKSSDAYRQAIALDPEFARAYMNLAENSLTLGLRAEARTQVEKAIDLAAAGRASLRDQLLFQGFYSMTFGTSVREAVKHYQKLLSLYPDDEDGLIFLGSLYRTLEEWDLSRECFERLLRHNKFNPVIYINLSTIYMARGFYAKAADILPSDPDRLSESFRNFYLSLVYLCQGRYEEALAEIENKLKPEPERLGNLLMRGNIRQLKGDLASAESDYLQVFKNSDIGMQTLGLSSLAHLYLQEGRFIEYRVLIAQGIGLAKKTDMKEDEFYFRAREASEIASRGDYATAEESALQAVRLAEELDDMNFRAEALNLLGKLQAARGKKAEAEKTGDQLKRLIDETGRNYLLRYYHHLKGMIALAEGDLASASDYCRKAGEGLPFENNTYTDMHAYFDESRAKIAEEAGDTDKAISLFRVLIARTSGRLCYGDLFVRSYYRLGKLLLKKNLRAEAADAFETFLRMWAGADPGLAEVTDARAELAALKSPVRPPAPKTTPAV
ncbi:MAG: protein kinase [Candidatus Aminicenantes bacterium]|nr:protein kinase [Candidatus Aminicenantes bacterium]